MYVHYEWNTLPLEHCWDYWEFLPPAETQAGLHIATISMQLDVFHFNILNINNSPFNVQGRVIPLNKFFVICLNSHSFLTAGYFRTVGYFQTMGYFLTTGYLATSLWRCKDYIQTNDFSFHIPIVYCNTIAGQNLQKILLLMVSCLLFPVLLWRVSLLQVYRLPEDKKSVRISTCNWNSIHYQQHC